MEASGLLRPVKEQGLLFMEQMFYKACIINSTSVYGDNETISYI